MNGLLRDPPPKRLAGRSERPGAGACGPRRRLSRPSRANVPLRAASHTQLGSTCRKPRSTTRRSAASRSRLRRVAASRPPTAWKFGIRHSEFEIATQPSRFDRRVEVLLSQVERVESVPLQFIPTDRARQSPRCHSDRASVAREWRNLWGGCWKIVAYSPNLAAAADCCRCYLPLPISASRLRRRIADAERTAPKSAPAMPAVHTSCPVRKNPLSPVCGLRAFSRKRAGVCSSP